MGTVILKSGPIIKKIGMIVLQNVMDAIFKKMNDKRKRKWWKI